MKIGYPCINLTLDCRSSHTFRLASYTEELFINTVKENLCCFKEILKFNKENNLLFFRISSDLIPFASHPICTFPWQEYFKDQFKEIGEYIKQNNMRISMHPDQFVLVNAINETIFENSVKELAYHANILNLLSLDTTHKIQIHVGGVYGNKIESMERFIFRYKLLSQRIKERLVIEDDDHLYSLKDCLYLNEKTTVPILFDNFHHSLLNSGEPLVEGMKLAFNTWKEKDGIPMIDYSSQQPGNRIGNHTQTIDEEKFKLFLHEVKELDFDMMLEIKDKDLSAIKALKIAEEIIGVQ